VIVTDTNVLMYLLLKYEISLHANARQYDCEFVALAARLGTKVVTMDAKILKAFPQYAAPLSEA